MGVKIECDGCHRQVPNEPHLINGWLTVSTIEHFPLSPGVADFNGMFCTPTCVVEKMRELNLVLPDVIREGTEA